MTTYGGFNNQNNVYFAAQKDPEALAADLLDRSQSFYVTMKANLYLAKVASNWQFYHGNFVDGISSGHQVSFTGEQGELVNLPVNHFRNIARHMYVMITSNRPVMDARAINTDYKSLTQATLANGILDYYMREKGLEDCIKRATEWAIVLGSAYVKMEWNATGGQQYDFDPDTGEYNYEGEIEFSTLSPFDVVFDGTKSCWDNEWLLVRTFKNKFDIAAKYPEYREKILSVPGQKTPEIWRLAIWSNDKTDDIPVYEFYHKRTEALPEGRYTLFLEDNIVLLDTPIPYRTLPIFRIAPENYIGTPYGYTPMFDIYPLQEAMNSLASAMMSNQEATAVQNIWVPRGSDIDVATLQGGMNIVTGNAKPEAINLEGTAKSTFEMYNLLVQTAELISGINSVTRGQPEASLKSGTSLALVQSMALQFMSGLQQSYVKLIEDLGTALIMYLKDFAQSPRVAEIVGVANKVYTKEFTGDDLNSINRVVVDVGNALAHTVAGRVGMAEQLLQMKLLTTPEQYLQIINTGELETSFENQTHELLLIKQENEEILGGSSPVVSPLDKHSIHINEHRGVISDPSFRLNPELRDALLDHIQQHIDALTNTDPRLLGILGEQPLPPPGGSPQAPQGPQGTPQGAPAASGANPLLQAMPTPPNPQQVAQGARLPQVPANTLPNPQLQQQAMGNVNFKK